MLAFSVNLLGLLFSLALFQGLSAFWTDSLLSIFHLLVLQRLCLETLLHREEDRNRVLSTG